MSECVVIDTDRLDEIDRRLELLFAALHGVLAMQPEGWRDWDTLLMAISHGRVTLDLLREAAYAADDADAEAPSIH